MEPGYEFYHVIGKKSVLFRKISTTALLYQVSCLAQTYQLLLQFSYVS